MTIEVRDKLRQIRRKAGVSLAEVLRQGLGLVEPKVDKAYERGLREGWGRFETPCMRCGKPIRFDIKTHRNAEEALAETFRNWYHTTCNRRTDSE